MVKWNFSTWAIIVGVALISIASFGFQGGAGGQYSPPQTMWTLPTVMGVAGLGLVIYGFVQWK